MDEATCLSVCRCPRLTCDKECEYGPVFDKSGCPTCECLGNPCAYTTCLRGTRCVTFKVLVPCTGMRCPPNVTCIKDALQQLRIRRNQSQQAWWR
ncbi:hypothetical protein LSAT2_026761 [Lamellibrachia satsuma]|nr:hypothetical protein LSAT2_026761 [Lamellibrachia satsuma]